MQSLSFAVSNPENTERLPCSSSWRMSTTVTSGSGLSSTRLGISSRVKSPRRARAKDRMLGVAEASRSVAPSFSQRHWATSRASYRGCLSDR